MSDTGAMATVGNPSARVAPATRQIAVMSIAGATSGAINRFASGATNDSRPNWTRINGSVAACAARETDSASTSHGGATRKTPRQPLMQRCGPGEQTGSGDGRKLESDVVDGCGIEREQPKARDRQGGLGLAAASGLPGDDHRRGHQGRPKDAGCRSRQDRVCRDREDHQHRPRTARQSAKQSGNDRAEHCDVPAADGHDMAQPGRAEVVTDLACDYVAQADGHRRGQTRLWLGQHSVDQVIGGSSDAFESCQR